MSSSDDESECPLCLNAFDQQDKQFRPCPCGYKVCIWCWHTIRQEQNACPACRTPYSSDLTGIILQPSSSNKQKRQNKGKQERGSKPVDVHAKPSPNTTAIHRNEPSTLSSSSSSSQLTGKQLAARALKSYKVLGKVDNAIREDLSLIRVLQRNLVYIVGLTASTAREDVLSRNDFFGQFGPIIKVAVNKKPSHGHGYTASYSAYVTFKNAPDARAAILYYNGKVVDGRTYRATYGTTKYCSYFLNKSQPCPNNTCLYLHALTDPNDSFTKEELAESDRFSVEFLDPGSIKAQKQSTTSQGASAASTVSSSSQQQQQQLSSPPVKTVQANTPQPAAVPPKSAWALPPKPVLFPLGVDAVASPSTSDSSQQESTPQEPIVVTAKSVVVPLTIANQHSTSSHTTLSASTVTSPSTTTSITPTAAVAPPLESSSQQSTIVKTVVASTTTPSSTAHTAISQKTDSTPIASTATQSQQHGTTPAASTSTEHTQQTHTQPQSTKSSTGFITLTTTTLDNKSDRSRKASSSSSSSTAVTVTATATGSTQKYANIGILSTRTELVNKPSNASNNNSSKQNNNTKQSGLSTSSMISTTTSTHTAPKQLAYAAIVASSTPDPAPPKQVLHTLHASPPPSASSTSTTTTTAITAPSPAPDVVACEKNVITLKQQQLGKQRQQTQKQGLAELVPTVRPTTIATTTSATAAAPVSSATVAMAASTPTSKLTKLSTSQSHPTTTSTAPANSAATVVASTSIAPSKTVQKQSENDQQLPTANPTATPSPSPIAASTTATTTPGEAESSTQMDTTTNNSATAASQPFPSLSQQLPGQIDLNQLDSIFTPDTPARSSNDGTSSTSTFPKQQQQLTATGTTGGILPPPGLVMNPSQPLSSLSGTLSQPGQIYPHMSAFSGHLPPSYPHHQHMATPGQGMMFPGYAHGHPYSHHQMGMNPSLQQNAFLMPHHHHSSSYGQPSNPWNTDGFSIDPPYSLYSGHGGVASLDDQIVQNTEPSSPQSGQNTTQSIHNSNTMSSSSTTTLQHQQQPNHSSSDTSTAMLTTTPHDPSQAQQSLFGYHSHPSNGTNSNHQPLTPSTDINLQFYQMQQASLIPPMTESFFSDPWMNFRQPNSITSSTQSNNLIPHATVTANPPTTAISSSGSETKSNLTNNASTTTSGVNPHQPTTVSPSIHPRDNTKSTQADTTTPATSSGSSAHQPDMARSSSSHTMTTTTSGDGNKHPVQSAIPSPAFSQKQLPTSSPATSALISTTTDNTVPDTSLTNPPNHYQQQQQQQQPGFPMNNMYYHMPPRQQPMVGANNNYYGHNPMYMSMQMPSMQMLPHTMSLPYPPQYPNPSMGIPPSHQFMPMGPHPSHMMSSATTMNPFHQPTQQQHPQQRSPGQYPQQNPDNHQYFSHNHNMESNGLNASHTQQYSPGLRTNPNPN